MKRAFTLVEALVLLAVVVVLTMLLLPLLARNRSIPRTSSCKTNLIQIGLGFNQYMQDYDSRFPPARVTYSTGWGDVLQPYLKFRTIFLCPSSKGGTRGFSSDYFYNRNLSRVATSKISNLQSTLLLGDGSNGPAWNSWAQLPTDATTNFSSPSQRHFNGAYYCFVDGHTKWLQPNQITVASSKPDSDQPRFALR